MKMYNNASNTQINPNDIYYMSGILHAAMILDDEKALESLIKNEMGNNLDLLKTVLGNENSNFKDSIYFSSLNCVNYLCSIEVLYLTLDKYNKLSIHVNDNTPLDENLLKI